MSVEVIEAISSASVILFSVNENLFLEEDDRFLSPGADASSTTEDADDVFPDSRGDERLSRSLDIEPDRFIKDVASGDARAAVFGLSAIDATSDGWSIGRFMVNVFGEPTGEHDKGEDVDVPIAAECTAEDPSAQELFRLLPDRMASGKLAIAAGVLGVLCPS